MGLSGILCSRSKQGSSRREVVHQTACQDAYTYKYTYKRDKEKIQDKFEQRRSGWEGKEDRGRDSWCRWRELQSVSDGSRTELCGYRFTVPSSVNRPPCRFSPSHPVSIRSSLSLPPFTFYSQTYQHQSNLICLPVRRTLTEFNVPVHTRVRITA